MELKTQPFRAVQGPPEVVLALELAESVQLSLTYTPDRAVVARGDVLAWAQELQQKSEHLEALAVALVDGFYDVVLPRQVAVVLSAEGQTVKVSRAQPQ